MRRIALLVSLLAALLVWHGYSSAGTPVRPVGIASTPSGEGHWLLYSDGRVVPTGDATDYGSATDLRLNQPLVGIAALPGGDGYWLVSADGGVFSFGNAAFYGSMGGRSLFRPMVGMTATPSGGGYWLVAADGGVFTFGDAAFNGSTGGTVLNKPVVGLAGTASGQGYWLVSADGGVFTFGDAPFYGSSAAGALNKPIVGIARTGSGQGYWLVAADGGVFTFGDAPFLGAANEAAVGVSGGQTYVVATRSGAGLRFRAGQAAEKTPPPADIEIQAEQAPVPPAPPAPPAPPVPSSAATGGFQVQGSTIFDPAGRPFVPLGVNLLGPNTWWDRPTAGLSDAMVTWGFNAVRLNTNYYDSGIHTNNDLAGIVDEFTGKGIVVMIEAHSFGNGGYPSGGELGTLQGWWAQVASQFKHNPYVWFNLMNEPGWEQVVPVNWLTVNEALVQTIRGVGADNLIVADGAAYGQDAFSWHTGPVDSASSAILTYGPSLAARYGNVAFSFHVYDQWTGGDARMADYIQRVRGAGLALMAGEVGDAGYVNGRYQDFTPAFDTCMRVCTSNGVGVFAWHGQGTGAGEGFRLVNDGPINTIDNPFSPGNLTHAGRAMWALGHS